MDCIVRKLKASVNNPALPVFENVILKNYITTTQDDQYIRIDNLISSDTQDTKVEVYFEATSAGSETSVIVAFGGCYAYKNQGYTKVYASGGGSNVALSANTEVHAGWDSHDGSWFVDSDTGSVTPPGTSYTANTLSVFGRPSSYTGSKAGLIKIKSIKLTDSNGGVYNFVPALVNNVAVLLEPDRGVYYGEYNGGTLVCG